MSYKSTVIYVQSPPTITDKSKKETKLTFLNIKLRFYEEDTSM